MRRHGLSKRKKPEKTRGPNILWLFGDRRRHTAQAENPFKMAALTTAVLVLVKNHDQVMSTDSA